MHWIARIAVSQASSLSGLPWVCTRESVASGIQEFPRCAGTSQVPGALECTFCRQSGVIARARGGSLACALAEVLGAEGYKTPQRWLVNCLDCIDISLLY